MKAPFNAEIIVQNWLPEERLALPKHLMAEDLATLLGDHIQNRPICNLTTFPPIVSITNPPGQTVNVGVGIMAPTFKATAIDPQDGDLCAASGVTLVWTDEQGKIGTGCNLVNPVFQNNGEFHVVFTATDAEGRTASSQPLLVTATYGKPEPYLVVPTSTQTDFMVGDSLDLEGGSSLGFKDLPCTSLVFKVYQDNVGTPRFSGVPSTAYSSVCHFPIQFDISGIWKITLTASSPDGSTATVERDVTVKALPPTLSHPYATTRHRTGSPYLPDHR